ncbi:peptidase domain-containing ABC transporter [Exilibacterium tricleocarpae]|uniref:Peptidase domain-containing ABC transporter n=1 Tax=Exilibacterium tricleocarpae TaxID=2591008 RepID=A0A545U4D9_9GAMM|nr:peptidase domain-containing ABC transporter [Exilibacterium tricleocarpae]TQV84263.1 peptidase domain-containing ABC transporter [Exilibacterium tricleocarpae]
MSDSVLGKLKFGSRHSLPVVLQGEASECGLASICMIANYYGHNIDLVSLRRKYPISLKGATLKQLVNIANMLHLSGRTLKVELDELKRLNTPVILHWNMNHFVVLASVNRNGITIHDPGKGLVNLTWKEASRSFTGIALELRPTDEFKEKDEEASLGFSVLWSSVTGLNGSILQILILSLLLQLFVLIFPYFIKLVVDNVIVTNDRNFLVILGVGFTLLTLMRVFTQAFRSWVIVYLRTILNIQLITNLFRHLLRLPMGWFGKRFVGDIISRFSSLDYIKDLLSEGFVEGIIDGAMAVLTLTMMYIFSPTLATISLIAVTLYVVSRLVLYQPMRNRTKEGIQLKAVATGMFYESVRSVQPIKVFSGESISQAKLENANAEWMNADIKLGRLEITQATFKELLYGLELVLIIWIGAYLVLGGDITLGVFFAFLSYRQQFAMSTQTLLDKIIQFRMMGLHLSRIADIALEDQEEALETEFPAPTNVMGKIEVENLSYRYNENEPYIFENLSFTIEAGECVVIVAPSGFGKTTLMKVLMGLLKASGGSVLVDGRDITQIGLNNYRQMTSAVMQGDYLLSGSIGDNISFFAVEQDMELLEAASRDACIYDDIMAMPMGFNTLAGDMGSTLSGGQVQRVLLARALYKQPKILYLDEASSALDVNTEKKINMVLKNMGITRIMIAHRKETIDMADRVIDILHLKREQEENQKKSTGSTKLEVVK